MVYGIQDITRNMFGLGSHPDILRKDEFWAIDDLSFELRKGETLGIIGSNGSGKTTLLKMLNGIFWPDKGSIMVRGRVGALIEVGAGFHPMLTGRENIFINAAILGMSKKEIDAKFDDIVAFADIGDFLDVPVKHYSSGMFVRLGFAVAVHAEPDILLIDEILSVGDAKFRAKCYNLIYSKLRQTATIFVSHDMYLVNRICSAVILMDKGHPRYFDNPTLGITAYLDTLSEDRTMLDGNGQAIIRNISVTGADGTNSVLTGQPCIISFDLTLMSEIKEYSIILSTLALDQMPVAFAKCTETSLQNKTINKSIRFTTTQLTLAPGKYSLSIAIFNEATLSQILWHYNVSSFKVSGNSDYIVPVELIGDWNIETAP